MSQPVPDSFLPQDRVGSLPGPISHSAASSESGSKLKNTVRRGRLSPRKTRRHRSADDLWGAEAQGISFSLQEFFAALQIVLQTSEQGMQRPNAHFSPQPSEQSDGAAPKRSGLARVSEAAAFLNVSRPYLYKLISQGDVPIKRVGSAIRIPWAWLEAQA